MISPILRHALESFEHGIEHYIEGSEKDRKFAYLHIDHSIELILKEKLREKGISFYKGKGETYNLHECIKTLERNSVKIQEKVDIELLHDNRNAIQHKGLTPDENTTMFEITQGYNFFKRFLKEELGENIKDCIPRRYIDLIEGKKSEPLKELASRLESAKERYGNKDYIGSVIMSAMSIELQLRELYKSHIPSHKYQFISFTGMVTKLKQAGILTNEDANKIKTIYHIRNKVVHTVDTPSSDEAKELLTMAQYLSKKFKNE